MFLNYQNVSNYVPNNMTCACQRGKSYTKLDPVTKGKPYEEYDVKGNLIGYSWYEGETVNLEFNIDGEVLVESDAIILSAKGEQPSEDIGQINQRAYNVAELKSWTCVSITENKRVWLEDSEFTYDESNTKSVYISASDYLKDKYISVTIFNFKMKPVYTVTFKGDPKIILSIDKDISSKLLKGIYYCSLDVFNDKIKLPIFGIKDCVLLVK